MKTTGKYQQGAEEGEGAMFGESNAETNTTIWKTDSQWEFAV